MELISLTGKWKGEYALGPEYEGDEGQCVNFTLQLIDKNGTFSGTCVDEETKELFSEPITVRGFWDNNIISFVKQYPFLYYKNEEGQTIVDRSKLHPEVAYTGEYNYVLNQFEGEFIVTQDLIELSDGGFLEWSLAGTWTMKKDETLLNIV